MMRDLSYRIRTLFRRRSMEAELDEELRAHIENQADKYLQSGLSRQEAERQAKLEFGGLEQVKEECRDTWGVRLITEIAQDVRYGLRQLRRNPSFTVVAVLMLALGIGVNSAIFSMVSAVYLASPSVQDPDHLVVIGSTVPRFSSYFGPVSSADFADWRSQNKVFADMAASATAEDTDLVVHDTPIDVAGMAVTRNYFRVLGFAPALGRGFLSGKDEGERNDEVILSDRLWRQHFGADPRIIGSVVTLNNRRYSVIGVMPRRAALWAGPAVWYGTASLWIPLAGPPSRKSRSLLVFGRLKNGIPVRQASAEMATIATRLAREYPTFDKGWNATVLKLQEYQARGMRGVRMESGFLMAAVSLVLLIACANVAGLLLAKAASRRQELAIRAALGAGRGRLVRQLISESLALVALGCATGLFLAWCGTLLLHSWLGFSAATRTMPLAIDMKVVAFTVAVSFLAVIFCALLPALGASRANPGAALKTGSHTGTATPSPRLRRFLVGGEIALAVVLLAAASVIVKNVIMDFTAGYGLNPHGIWSFTVNLPEMDYRDPASRFSFFETAASRVSALPGVSSAAVVNGLPVALAGGVPFSVTGNLPANPRRAPWAAYYDVSPGYFQTMQIPLLRGRSFTDDDKADSPPVVIINQALARRFFAGKDPVGQYIALGGAPFVTLKGAVKTRSNFAPRCRIVGVVGNVKDAFGQPGFNPQVYTSVQQAPLSGALIVIRWRGGGAPSGPTLVRTVWSAGSENVVVGYPAPMGRVVDRLGGGEAKLIAKLMGTFAFLALLLAAVGVYGVISYIVTQRTHEIGVRVALGARRRDVIFLVLRESALVGGCGLAVGLAAATALPRVLGSVFFRLSPHQAPVLAGVAVVMAAVVLLATYIPARRAANVDPIVALRYE